MALDGGNTFNPTLTPRKQMEQRLAGMRTDRYSWWVHWQELANYILPRRYMWLVTANQMNRGSPINGFILDSTGTRAARTLASGMLSGMCSPTRPWFRLRVEGWDMETTNPVTLWLAEIERRMRVIFQRSNFYNAMGVAFFDLVVFGTSAIIVYDDDKTVICCYNPCLGEYYVANGYRGAIDTFYREIVLKVPALVAKFGIEKCTPSTQRLWRQGGAGWATQIKVNHGIEPNTPALPGINKDFAFREVYWEEGAEKDLTLKETGYFELPAMVPRWDLSGDDAYGRSPGMDALGDVKQLQQETKRKAQAIDKMVNPPLLADVEMKNQPASMLPGGVSYVSRLANDRPGIKPVYTVMPPVQEIMLDIQEVQNRIRDTFFNDLFLMISQLDTVRTATEIDARREEKLILLGPVLERLQNELLDPVIERTFNIMLRRGLLPTPPMEVAQGGQIQVQYVSMLAEAQRAVQAAGIERTFAVVGNVSALVQDAPDNIDFDRGIQKYGSYMRVDPEIIRAPEAVQELRMKRQQAQEAEAALAASDTVVKGAKVLSDTKLGGGQSALDAMVQGQTVQ